MPADCADTTLPLFQISPCIFSSCSGESDTITWYAACRKLRLDVENSQLNCGVVASIPNGLSALLHLSLISLKLSWAFPVYGKEADKKRRRSKSSGAFLL